MQISNLKSGNHKLLVGLFCFIFIHLCLSVVPLYAGSFPNFDNGNGGDWSAGYYRPISITNNTSGTLTDFQVLVTLTTTELGNPYANIKSDGSDIRFAPNPPSDSGNELSYYIESFSNTGTSKIWVKVPSMAVGNSYIYMYYGNNSAIGTSNGDSTFLLCDDFNDGSLNWNIVSGTNWTENSGLLKETAEAPFNRVKKSFSDTGDLVYEFSMRHTGTVGGGNPWAGIQIRTPDTDYPNYDQGYLLIAYAHGGTTVQDRFRILKCTAGVATELASGSCTFYVNQWHKYKISYTNNNTIKVYVDDVLVCSATNAGTYTTGQVMRLWVAAASQIGADFDNVHVRKYASSEPNVGAVDSEQTTYPVPPPALSGLSRNQGTVDDTITISGTNLGAAQGTSYVTFNSGVQAVCSSWSDTQIICTVPANAQTGNVLVTTFGGISNGLNFTVLPSGFFPYFSRGQGGNWQNGYYRAIPITNTTDALTDFQVLLTLTTTELGNPYANIKSDGSDIRFTSNPPPDSGNELSYYIESFSNTGASKIWVKVPSLPAGNSYIYMYYGNNSATSSSNGNSTFLLFDDFDDGSLNWNVVAGNNWTENSGLLKETAEPPFNRVKKSFSDTGDLVYEFSMRHTGTVGGGNPWAGIQIRTPDTDYTSYDQGYLLIAYAHGGTTVQDRFRILKCTAGVATELAYGNRTFYVNQWHNYKISYTNNNTIKVYVDDTLVCSTTNAGTYTTGQVMRLWVAAASMIGADFDNVHVRKYASSEPVVGTAGSEILPNSPPVMASPGDKVAYQNVLLTFVVTAIDPDNDPLTYSAGSLPAGATFTPTNQTFSWLPVVGQANIYPDVTFTVTDSGGLTDTKSITITVLVDNTPPVISNPTPAPNSCITDTQPAISVSYSDTGSGINTNNVRLFVDFIDQTASATITNSGISFIPATPLTESIHRVDLSVTDNAGNPALLIWSFTVDFTPPIIVAAPLEAQIIPIHTLFININYIDPWGIDISSVKITLNNIDITSLFTINANWATCQITLSDGPYVMVAEVKDLAGNLASLTRNFRVVSAFGVIQPAPGGTVTVLIPDSPLFGTAIEVPPAGVVVPTTLIIQQPTTEVVAALPSLPPEFTSAGPLADFVALPETVFYPVPPTTIRVRYNEDAIIALRRSELDVKLFKYDSAQNEWINVPILLPIDTANNLVTAQVTTLGIFQAVISPLERINIVVIPDVTKAGQLTPAIIGLIAKDGSIARFSGTVSVTLTGTIGPNGQSAGPSEFTVPFVDQTNVPANVAFGSPGVQIITAIDTFDPVISGSAPVTVTAGNPGIFTKVAGDNQVGLISTTLTQTFQAQVTDRFGTPISGQAVTYTVTQGSGQFIIDPPPPLPIITVWTDSDGIAAASPFILGPIGEINYITADFPPPFFPPVPLPLTFRAAATTQFLSPPESTTPPATNAQYIPFSGTALPGYTINIYYNEELVASTVALPSGFWSAVSFRAFEEGNYTFSIQVADPINGIYSNYGSIPICVDRTPPNIVISDPAPSTILTPLHALNISIYFVDGPGPGSGINILAAQVTVDNYAHYYYDDLMIHPSDMPGYQYRADIVLPYTQFLTLGQHNIFAQVYDNAGNPAATATTYESQNPATKAKETPQDVRTAGDPVYLNTGEFYQQATDLTIPGRGFPLRFIRKYRSQSNYNGPLGYGWDFNYNARLESVPSSLNYILHDGSGREELFIWTGTRFEPPAGIYKELAFIPATSFAITDSSGTVMTFTQNQLISNIYNLTSIKDRNNNTLTLTYGDNPNVAGNDYVLLSITDTLNRNIIFTWDIFNRIDYLTDFANRRIDFGYDINGDLISVTSPTTQEYPSGKTTTYGYDATHNMTTVTDPKGQTYITNVYYNDRVIQQTYGEGIFYFVYEPGKVTVTDRNTNITEYYLNADGTLLSEIKYTRGIRPGDPLSYTTNYAHNLSTERTGTIHPKGNFIDYNFSDTTIDPKKRGNLFQVKRRTTDLQQITTSFTYEPRYNEVKTSTDAKGNTTTFYFDYEEVTLGDLNGDGLTNQANGNVVKIVYPTVTLPDSSQQIIESKFWYNNSGQVIRAIDPENIITAYEYYSSGTSIGYLYRVTRDFGGLNITSSYEYDIVGNIIGITDAKGNKTTFEVNAFNQVAKNISRPPFNYEVKFSYDAVDNLEQIQTQNIDENGNLDSILPWISKTYQYDILDNMINKTEQISATESATTQYLRDANENLTDTIQPESNISKTIYDELNRVYQSVEGFGALTPLLSRNYYDANSNLIRTEIGDGAKDTTTYQYDGFDRRTKTTDALGNYSITEYDNNNNVTHTSHFNNLGLKISDTFYYYDELNRMWKSIEKKFNTPGGVETDVITANWYDKKGRRWKTVDAKGNSTTTVFDNLDRIQSITDVLGNKVEYQYDANGNATTITKTEYPGPTTYTTINAYDNLDRLTSSTDNLNNVTEYKYDSRNNNKWTKNRENNITRKNYDAINRLRENIYELTPTETITVKYGRDKNGRLVTLTDNNNNVTQYEYDEVNRKNREILPDSSQKNYTFGQYGELTTITDPNGSVINNTYDNVLRLIQKNIARGSDIEGTTQETFSYDGFSRMIQTTNYDGVTLISNITMNYDSLNNLLQETQQIGTQSVKSVASVYDIMSFRTFLTYPDTRVISYVPDILNRIDLIKEGSNNIADYNYEGSTRVKERTYLNGMKLSVTYDGNNRATNYEHRTTTNDLIAGFEYTFDKESNKLYEKRIHESPVKGDAYLYDAIYRLTGVKYGIESLTPSITYTGYTTYDSKEEFGLDGVGNRIQVTNGATVNYTTNNLNQYTQVDSTNLTYDLNGNLKDDGVNTYVYDYANRLLKVTRKSDSKILGEYSYDTLGRRISKNAWVESDSSYVVTYFYYDGMRCTEERNASDIVTKSYVFGNGIDEVLTMERNGQTYYYHENSLGSIYVVTDNSSNVIERYKYTAYGKPSFFDTSDNPITNSLISNNYLFTGREYDSETGLYYYQARYYNVEMGRFLQRDIIVDDNLNNLYTYVRNNPVNWRDPTGKKILLNVNPSETTSQAQLLTDILGAQNFPDDGFISDLIRWALETDCVTINLKFENNPPSPKSTSPKDIIGGYVTGTKGEWQSPVDSIKESGAVDLVIRIDAIRSVSKIGDVPHPELVAREVFSTFVHELLHVLFATWASGLKCTADVKSFQSLFGQILQSTYTSCWPYMEPEEVSDIKENDPESKKDLPYHYDMSKGFEDQIRSGSILGFGDEKAGRYYDKFTESRKPNPKKCETEEKR